MAKAVKPIPEGKRTLTPHLVVRGANAAITFYKSALGAEETAIHCTPDGQSVVHAELKIGDSSFYLNDEFPEMGAKSPLAFGGTAVTLHLWSEDVDALFARAVKAGAKVVMPLADQFWGDRYGVVDDPFGHRWSMSTQVNQLSKEEIAAASAAFFADAAKASAK